MTLKEEEEQKATHRCDRLRTTKDSLFALGLTLSSTYSVVEAGDPPRLSRLAPASLRCSLPAGAFPLSKQPIGPAGWRLRYLDKNGPIVGSQLVVWCGEGLRGVASLKEVCH